jgi:hypothetical protein
VDPRAGPDTEVTGKKDGIGIRYLMTNYTGFEKRSWLILRHPGGLRKTTKFSAVRTTGLRA